MKIKKMHSVVWKREGIAPFSGDSEISWVRTFWIIWEDIQRPFFAENKDQLNFCRDQFFYPNTTYRDSSKIEVGPDLIQVVSNLGRVVQNLVQVEPNLIQVGPY